MTDHTCIICGDKFDRFTGEFMLAFHRQYGWTGDTKKQPVCEPYLESLKSKGVDEVVEEVFKQICQRDNEVES